MGCLVNTQTVRAAEAEKGGGELEGEQSETRFAVDFVRGHLPNKLLIRILGLHVVCSESPQNASAPRTLRTVAP